MEATLRAWRENGPPQLEGVSRVIEVPNTVAVEGISNIGLLGARFDVEFYRVSLPHEGQATLAVYGLIAPAPRNYAKAYRNIEQNTRTVQSFAESFMNRSTGGRRW